MSVLRISYEKMPVCRWTADEAEHHLAQTFNHEAKHFPDIMERYVVLLDSEEDRKERIYIMRSGLRESVKERYLTRYQEALCQPRS